ncbi:MAG: DUF5711 family protein [Firmicutes bacterium]|nr:DUF5711 family protein [Bacillota bacterium]
MAKAVKRRKGGGLLSLIVLILIGVLVFKFTFIMNSAIGFLNFNKEAIEKINVVELEDVIDLNMYDSDGKNLYVVNSSKLEKYDENGQVLWHKDIVNNNIILKSMNEETFIVDKNQGDIFKIDGDGKILNSKYALGNIDNFKVNEESYCSFLSTDKKKISVLNRDLENVTEIEINSGDVLDYDISRENNIVVVSVLDLNESSVITKIVVFDLDGKMVGAFNYNNRILYKLNIKGDKVIALGDDILFSFTIKDGDQWENRITEDLVAQEFLPNGDVTLFLREKEADLVESKMIKSLVTYDVDGNEKYRSEITDDLLAIYTLNDITVATLDKELLIFDGQGKLLSRKSVSDKIDDLRWISKNKFVVRSGQNLNFYKLN